MLLAGAAMGARTLNGTLGVTSYYPPLEGTLAVHGLLCKTRRMEALRVSTRTSTIKLFSFRPRSREGLQRQPFQGDALRIR